MAAVPPGSYLVVSHAMSGDLTDAQREGLNEVYAKTNSGGVTQRPVEGIGLFFDGLELVKPGLVEISAWRPPAERTGEQSARRLFYGGVGMKPSCSRAVSPSGLAEVKDLGHAR
jgi:hypothetical protein